jgi:hypothetical protein
MQFCADMGHVGRRGRLIALLVLLATPTSACAMSASQPNVPAAGNLCVRTFADVAAAPQHLPGDLDTAIRRCSSLQEWSQAASLYPRALAGEDSDTLLLGRCADPSAALQGYLLCGRLAASLATPSPTPRRTKAPQATRKPTPDRTPSRTSRPKPTSVKAVVTDARVYRYFRAIQSVAWHAYGRYAALSQEASSQGMYDLMASQEALMARFAGKQVSWLMKHPVRACFRTEWGIQLKSWRVLGHAGRMMAKALRSHPMGDTNAAFDEYDRGLALAGRAADMTSHCH